jgi:hypothetical protein
MHYFWWRSRLLWIERNCPFAERKRLYAKIIIPELWKTARHFLAKSLQALFTKQLSARQKALRNKAGLAGALHFAIKRFGNCPSWLIKSKT